MALFSLFKKKAFFSADEQKVIVAAITAAEKETSGEIRIFVESKNSFVDPLDRAKEVFAKLHMQKTKHRNAVLLYMATDHKELALFADEGVYTTLGKAYWESAVTKMITHFVGNNIVTGVEQCIKEIGQTLKEKFPFDPSDDHNELSNDIVFGK
ncbi:MAG TPA: TPM domain-containing protein [Ferruginibacter sp.]|nr:TPM domain-containing protein [Ferruginibacter sp.]